MSINKKVTFVYNSSPLLGRAPPFSGIVFSWFKEDTYFKHLSNAIDKLNIGWNVQLDKTEADIDEIRKNSSIIVCAPGLKYQFFTSNFNKNKIIYLSTMEYANNDTRRVTNLVMQTEKESQNG